MVYDAGKKLGNYQLLNLLGQGGNADVYLGEHVYLKSLAAIKVLRLRLDEEALQQFITEARTIVRLKHPHIVSVHDFGIEDGDPFLVMDYASHGSLRALHAVESILPATTVLAYIKPVAQALDYAHERKIIHRDVKPENILLGDDEKLLLSDFGIALTMQSMPGNSLPGNPQSADIRGTTTYMAPEIFVSTSSFLSDQYSLGIVAYEWLCGQPPFRGSDMEVALQHVHVPAPALQTRAPDLPATIAEVVMKALAKAPEERYPSIIDFADAFEEVCERAGLSVTPNVKLMLPGGNASATSLRIRALSAQSSVRQPVKPLPYKDPTLLPKDVNALPAPLGLHSVKLPAQVQQPVATTKRLFDYVPESPPVVTWEYESEPTVQDSPQIPALPRGQFALHLPHNPDFHSDATQHIDPVMRSASSQQLLKMAHTALKQPSRQNLQPMLEEGRKALTIGGRGARVYRQKVQRVLTTRLALMTLSLKQALNERSGKSFPSLPASRYPSAQLPPPYAAGDLRVSHSLPAMHPQQRQELVSTRTVPVTPSQQQMLRASQRLPTVKPPSLQSESVISRRMLLGGLTVLGIAGIAGIVGTVRWQDMQHRAQATPPPPVAPKPTATAIATATPEPSPTPVPAPVNLQIINSTRPTLASWGVGQLDLFVRGSDGNLWHRHFDGTWHPWTVVQGGMVFDPAVVSWAIGRFDVFARGADNTLQHCWYDGNWHPWESLGGALTSNPAVISWGPNRLDIFVRSTDNGLYHKWYDGTWHDWEALGGVLNSSPAAATWGPNRLDAFARGSDNALWHIGFDGTWHGWESLGGTLASDPGAVATTVNHLDVYALSPGNALMHRSYDGTWEAWDTLSGVLTSSPSVISWGNGRIDMFGRDAHNALEQASNTGQWSPWMQIP